MNLPELTDRQRQCLHGFLKRKTAKEIARELGIGHHAVEQHFKAARRKLGATTTAEAARLYFGSVDTTAEPYYGVSDLSVTPEFGPTTISPVAGPSLLRDSATDESEVIQSLSAGQTLIAVGICGVGAITILSLIVAVANGVAQLAH
jgi:DNA-binding CsgD family transcriptional regulator